jgi:hypothetical protein
MRWIDRPFIDYLNAADDLLEARHSVASKQADIKDIADAQDAGWTPAECAAWVTEKRGLKPVLRHTIKRRREL